MLFARSRRTSISSTSSPRAAPPRPRPPRRTLPTTPRIPASKGPTRPRTPPPDPLRAARRRRARAGPSPTPRRRLASATRTLPRPRPSTRRRRRRPRRGRRRRPPRARPRTSRFDSARRTTSCCASPAMARARSSDATPRDRPGRRTACSVVDFRDHAASRASAHRAPRLESPLTTTSLSPFSRSRAIMHLRGFRLPIAQVQGSVQLGALHPRGRAGNARDASQRDPGVRLGHVRLSPGTSPRANVTRCFFFRCFSRTARPLVVASVCSTRKSRDGFRNAIVGRVGRAAAATSARSRSIAVDRSRTRRSDRPDPRLPAERARGAPPRDADRGGLVPRDSTRRAVTTRGWRESDVAARRLDEKKNTNTSDIKRNPSENVPSRTRAANRERAYDESRFSRRFTSPRLGASAAGGTS